VKRNPAEDIVSFLSFSAEPCEHLKAVEKLSARKWTHVLQWLDDSGLAFYFLQKLRETHATNAVPGPVLSRLEDNFAANQLRVKDMSRRFGDINHRFDEAGVRYAVLKGFSLVPQFCPDATLRYQGDFDYLVEDQSLPTARRVLGEIGYCQKPQLTSQEFTFAVPQMARPARSAEQYQARAPHVVELHLDVWDSDLNRLPLMQRQFSAERTTTHIWNQLAFPALSDEDAFLLQVLHTCRHLFTYWIRMSCLLEIARFLASRASDEALWSRIEQRVGDNWMLRELTVVTTELVAGLFAAPVPRLIRDWGRGIRSATRVWTDHYARRCAFCDLPVYQFKLFPRSKLILFLHQQYEGACAEKNLVRNQLIVPSRLARIASSVRNKPSLVLNAGWWKRQLLMRRSIFHILAGARYVCELPRWWWLNRATARPLAESLDGQVRGGSLDSDFRATN
jgi:hypothetical protein